MSRSETGVGLLEVACASRRDYLPHCAAMVHSLLERAAPPELVSVHLLIGADVSDTELERLGSMVRSRGAAIAFHRVDEGRVSGLRTTGDLPTSHWYRVALPELLPDLKRILYLDCDLIVLDSLLPLWRTDLEGHALGAIANVFPNPDIARRFCASLGLDDPSRYFNSGVMLLDLERLRELDAPRRVIDYASAHPELLLLPEQDAVNAVLAGDWLALPPRWNCMNAVVEFPWAVEIFGAGAVAEARGRPAIRHFEGSGANKPWHPEAPAEAQELYRRHREATPWAIGPPVNTSEPRMTDDDQATDQHSRLR